MEYVIEAWHTAVFNVERNEMRSKISFQGVEMQVYTDKYVKYDARLTVNRKVSQMDVCCANVSLMLDNFAWWIYDLWSSIMWVWM